MIRNITKRTIIARQHKLARSCFSKALGLMFSRQISDFGLVFPFNSEKKRALHMFFVFYPIDVMFLDSTSRIVEMKESLKPFSLFFPKKDSSTIVELPAGLIKKSRSSVGDKVLVGNKL